MKQKITTWLYLCFIWPLLSYPVNRESLWLEYMWYNLGTVGYHTPLYRLNCNNSLLICTEIWHESRGCCTRNWRGFFSHFAEWIFVIQGCSRYITIYFLMDRILTACLMCFKENKLIGAVGIFCVLSIVGVLR